MVLRPATAILCPGNCRSRPNRGHRMALRLACAILWPSPCPNQEIFEELLAVVSRRRALRCPAAEPQDGEPPGRCCASHLRATQKRMPLLLCRQLLEAEIDCFCPSTQTRKINHLCRERDRSSISSLSRQGIQQISPKSSHEREKAAPRCLS